MLSLPGLTSRHSAAIRQLLLYLAPILRGTFEPLSKKLKGRRKVAGAKLALEEKRVALVGGVYDIATGKVNLLQPYLGLS